MTRRKPDPATVLHRWEILPFIEQRRINSGRRAILETFEDTRYDSVSLDLQPGDVLVFVSDGILECENGEQEAFGVGRLGALLNSLPRETSADAICSAIYEYLSAIPCIEGPATPADLPPAAQYAFPALHNDCK